jgi:hypothetical protein
MKGDTGAGPTVEDDAQYLGVMEGWPVAKPIHDFVGAFYLRSVALRPDSTRESVETGAVP